MKHALSALSMQCLQLVSLDHQLTSKSTCSIATTRPSCGVGRALLSYLISISCVDPAMPSCNHHHGANVC